MTEAQKNCPCCHQPAPLAASQCPSCGYDYRPQYTLAPPQPKSAEAGIALIRSPTPKPFAALTFAAPILVLPPLAALEEEAPASGYTPNKRSLPILLGSLGAATMILLLVVGNVVIQARQRMPGPQAKALADLMKPYEQTSKEPFTAMFGVPTTHAAKTIQGTPYDFWNYKCSDGAALVTFNLRSNQIEQVKAIGAGS